MLGQFKLGYHSPYGDLSEINNTCFRRIHVFNMSGALLRDRIQVMEDINACLNVEKMATESTAKR
jgi:hypothetical protein